MTKLNWSRGYEADPARVQHVDDFVTPDRVIISITPVKSKKRRTSAQLTERNMRRKISRESASGETTPKSESKPSPNKVAKQLPKRAEKSDDERRLAAEEKSLAKKAHNKRYIEKADRQRSSIAAKKKGHLQDWAEKQLGLREPRNTLRMIWRNNLLRQKNGAS